MQLVKGSWKVPIGQTYRRNWILMDLDGGSPHTAIAGVTGSGKSEALKLILYVLCRQQSPKNLRIHIIDLKGGATFAAFENLPHVEKVYATTYEALVALCYCEQVMWDRLEQIRAARKAFRKTPTFPILLLLIDEGGELSPADAIGDEKELRKACMETLSTLVRVGREPGLRIIYGTQRPDKSTLPMTVRSQLENKLCFRVSEDYDSRIVLGHEGAEKLPKIPGRMIFKSPDGEVPVQATYIPPDVLEAWLKGYAGFVDVQWREDDEFQKAWDRAREQARSKMGNKPETSDGSTSSTSLLDITDLLGDS